MTFLFLYLLVSMMGPGQSACPAAAEGMPDILAVNGLQEMAAAEGLTDILAVNGLQEMPARADTLQLIANGLVRYSDFAARGDGQADDIEAIIATHEFANRHGLQVKADKGAAYYIGGMDRTAVIQTNTDFGTASFIIDDTDVENRSAPVFLVRSSMEPFKPDGITALVRNQENIGVSLPVPSLITVTNSHVRRYIRFGPNQNDGAPQTDLFIVDRDGNVDMDAPIIWDFDQITDITALPIDEAILTITGGRFTTIANQADSRYTYYSRGIEISRSNVVVDGLEHHVTGEGEHGAPYSGFIIIRDCAGVTIRNTLLTGRKTYQTIGSAGVTVSMGSYGLLLNRALNVSLENVNQTNDINDRTYWGIMGSNYCKNLVLDNCEISRFDAHMGVANATIRNSTLGHQGINAIGSGTFLVENSTIYGRSLINLRRDYGSTWEGEFLIRNSVFVPSGGRTASASLIHGSNSGQHDFGYKTYMPERITIENLHIDDSNHPDGYQGPAIFANFNPGMTDDTYTERYPYTLTKEVILRNVTTASGKSLRISDNLFMFRDVKVTTEDPVTTRDSYTADHIVTYKKAGNAALELHIFLPDDHKPSDSRPAIVFFHGGGWNGGSPKQFYPHSDYLSARGMVAITAGYRLKNTHGTTPREAVMDGKSAMRWVRRHAEEWGIDPDMIAAGGGSAGGQIAAATATVHGFDDEGEDPDVSVRPNALVLFNPVYDNGPDGYGYDRVEAYWREFSPLHNIDENTPPAIVFLGTEDHLVPVATAEEFRDRMLQHGIRSELLLFEGAGHGFFNYRGDKQYYRATVAEMDRFLTSLGYLSGSGD